MNPESFQREELRKPGAERKDPEILRKGEYVKIIRSSGNVEDGWEIAGFSQESGDALVQRESGLNDKKKLLKSIPLVELYALNKPGGESKRFAAGDWARLWSETSPYPKDIREEIEREMSRIDANTPPLAPKEARRWLRNTFGGFEGKSPQTMQKDEISGAIEKLKKRALLFGMTPKESDYLKSLEVISASGQKREGNVLPFGGRRGRVLESRPANPDDYPNRLKFYHKIGITGVDIDFSKPDSKDGGEKAYNLAVKLENAGVLKMLRDAGVKIKIGNYDYTRWYEPENVLFVNYDDDLKKIEALADTIIGMPSRQERKAG